MAGGYRTDDEVAFTSPMPNLVLSEDQQLQEVQYQRHQGFPFSMVFAYHPNGQLLYTGDLGTIRDNVSDAPTHHGFVVHYRGGERRSIPTGHAVTLLGKYSHNGYRRQYLSLQYVDSERGLFGQFFEGRPKFVLSLNRRAQEPVVLHSWRRLPKCYLKQLKEADRILDEHTLH